ncbi:hypothetical protein [Nocardia sp. NPDC051981]|uniref:hypothetical protein n=1 Tax=unclassified Nocardia TaxID=2637762 RepID=UPI0034242105
MSWARLTLQVWANVMSYEVAVSAQDANGRSAGEVSQPAVTDLLVRLRNEMYEPDRGAWLSARFVLNRGEEPDISFNYDDDPQWSPDLHPLMYARDLEVYPRAEQHVPQWLQDRVAFGLELERQHEADGDTQ